MIAQIDSRSREVLSFFICLLCARNAPPTHSQHTPSTPVTDSSPIDPRAISLLDERRYAGQHMHDSANSLLADE